MWLQWDRREVETKIGVETKRKLTILSTEKETER